MSLLDRLAARLGYTPTPKAQTVSTSTLTSNTDADLYSLLIGGTNNSALLPLSPGQAMSISAVYACIALIGAAVGACPLQIYRKTTSGALEPYDTDLWYLFNESPMPRWTAPGAWNWTIQSICLRGDSYWYIERASAYSNNIIGFRPLHPDATNVQLRDDRLIYTYTRDDGKIFTRDQDDILHFPGIGYNGIRSLSPLQAALRVSGGIAHAASTYAAAYFANGARPDIAILTEAGLTEEQAAEFYKTWDSRHRGPEAAHRPALIPGGMKVETLQLSAEDSQLIETRKTQVEEICAIHGVPPVMIGHSGGTSNWGTGVEAQALGFVRFSLTRYLAPIAAAINARVWPSSRLFVAKHVTDSLTAADSKTLAEILNRYAGGSGNQQLMTVNEIRHRLNLPPDPQPWCAEVQKFGTKPSTETTPPTPPQDPAQ